MAREKNLSIELLKFLAVIIVANSHMEPLYGKYDFLATGGAIGDVLFFFVSGYTLFLGRFGRFDNWYKRRIKRIYPSIISWAILLSFIGIQEITFSRVVKGYTWFISCIMLYYIALYFIRKYYSSKPLLPFIVCTVFVLLWYFFEDISVFFMYGATYFKWLYYFLFMLMGAYVGNKTIELKSSSSQGIVLLIISLISFYGFMVLLSRFKILAYYQVISLVPLIGIVLYSYRLCSTSKVEKLMKSKFGFILRFVAGLCLESYIVQMTIIRNQTLSDLLNPIFPINLLITFLLIIILAYFIRCFARIISQTFETEDYDWNFVFRAVD